MFMLHLLQPSVEVVDFEEQQELVVVVQLVLGQKIL